MDTVQFSKFLKTTHIPTEKIAHLQSPFNISTGVILSDTKGNQHTLTALEVSQQLINAQKKLSLSDEAFSAGDIADYFSSHEALRSIANDETLNFGSTEPSQWSEVFWAADDGRGIDNSGNITPLEIPTFLQRSV